MPEHFQAGHALIIGAGGDLANTVNDAKGLADIFCDQERCGYPENQVVLLAGAAASKGRILTELDNLSKVADDSTVVIYFSGHGYLTRDGSQQYYLMPNGYDLGQLGNTAIEESQFSEKLYNIKTGKLLILLDCCYAGGVAQVKAPTVDGQPAPELVKSSLPPEAFDKFSQGKGRVLIASSTRDELSYAGKPYSAFTLALIRSLCGKGTSQEDGYVRASDLALYARETVPNLTNKKQHPVFDFKQADNFAVSYYAGGSLKPKGLPAEIEKPEIEIDAGSNEMRGIVFVTNNSGPVTNINNSGGFVQSGWTVGTVNQAAGDMHIVVENGKKKEKD